VRNQAKRLHGSRPPQEVSTHFLELPPGCRTWLLNADVTIPVKEGNRMGGLDKNNGCKLKQNKTITKQISGVNLLFITSYS
jgi:hypothetical protein